MRRTRFSSCWSPRRRRQSRSSETSTVGTPRARPCKPRTGFGPRYYALPPDGTAARGAPAVLGSDRPAGGTRAGDGGLRVGWAEGGAGAAPHVRANWRAVGRPPLTTALSALADLVAGGGPSATAAAAVLVLAP